MAEASVKGTPFDLHVLSTPPAFILSRDQTLNNMVSKQTKVCLNQIIEAYLLASKKLISETFQQAFTCQKDFRPRLVFFLVFTLFNLQGTRRSLCPVIAAVCSEL